MTKIWQLMQTPISITDPTAGDIAARKAPGSTTVQPTTASATGFRDLVRAAHTAKPAGLQGTRAAGDSYVIAPGDTLSEIARRQLQEHGRIVNGSSIAREVDRLAKANGISDPNRIFAGATLQLSAPDVAGDQRSAGEWSRAATVSPVPAARPAPGPVAGQPMNRTSAGWPIAPASGPQRFSPFQSTTAKSTFPQLERTLDRAVERGYMSAAERQPVLDRVVQMGRKYQFSPDDFATVALMESDGLNPRATNGRCHGIIQFCEGPSRGAASVGMQGRAADIGGMSVLEQLELVDRYFEDTRLGDNGAVSLVDLYLTVLTPAARTERRVDAPLDISGRQARVLYPAGDRAQPITRTSLVSGLISHARSQLEPLGRLFSPNPTAAPAPIAQSVPPVRAGTDPRSAVPAVGAGGIGQSTDHKGRQG